MEQKASEAVLRLGRGKGLDLKGAGQTGTLQKSDQPRKRLSRVDDCEFAIDSD